MGGHGVTAMAFIQTGDGTKLFFNDWGSGPPVLLVHGWPLNADMWEYQARFLAERGFRCIAYDRRGFGRSDQPWSGYDYDTMADDLAALIEHLDLRAACLVGFSMGGGEVVRYMARHGRDRIASAVLMSAVTPFLLRTNDNPRGVAQTTFDQMIAGLETDRPHFLASFGKQFFGTGLLHLSVSGDILAWTQGLALQASARATIACVRAFSATDFRTDMRACAVPTLVMHGDGDATVPIDVSGRVAASMLPDARLMVYPGAPHALFFTERNRVNADLLAFLRGEDLPHATKAAAA